MSKLPIITYPSKSLKEKSARVDDIHAVQELCTGMIETMVSEKGIGLSAPQVGQNVRVIAIHKDAEKSLDDNVIMINPKIFSQSKEKEKAEEGCLSFPGVFLSVERSKKIKVRYTDVAGQEQKIKAANLFARVIQHEIDHLDGILFIDRADKMTKGF